MLSFLLTERINFRLLYIYNMYASPVRPSFASRAISYIAGCFIVILLARLVFALIDMKALYMDDMPGVDVHHSIFKASRTAIIVVLLLLIKETRFASSDSALFTRFSWLTTRSLKVLSIVFLLLFLFDIYVQLHRYLSTVLSWQQYLIISIVLWAMYIVFQILKRPLRPGNV